MTQLVYLVLTIVLVQKASVTAKSIGGRDTLAVLSLRVTEGSGSIDSATVESLASPCSEQCDGDGGKCDNEGRCVCKQGRTGPDCSKKNPDFPTDPAAKLDIALSILAAILLVSLVVCALLPKRQISCRRESRDNQSEDVEKSQRNLDLD